MIRSTHDRRTARRFAALTASVTLVAIGVTACSPSQLMSGCSAGLTPPVRPELSAGVSGPGTVEAAVDPESLPVVDTFGIGGAEAASLKQRTDSIAGPVADIARSCAAFTGTEPDRQMLNTWLTRLSRGASLDALNARLATTGGYQRLYANLDDSQFVVAAYANSVRRDATPTEVAAGVSQLRRNTSRRAFLGALAHSLEARAVQEKSTYVLAVYQAITKASPTSGDLERYTSDLADTGLKVQVVEDIALTRAPARQWAASISGGEAPSL